MTKFFTGVHTIEFQTANQLRLSALPEEYRKAIKPEGSNRYRLTLPKLPDVPEYPNPADAQEIIKAAYTTFADVGAGHCTTTRIDYRLDDHEGTYAENLPLMTVMVNLIAYVGGIYDRRVFFTDGNGVITSVRCMPDEKDGSSRYGVEYYDKPRQAKTDEYGNARLELRRLNMEGETVPCIVREWRDMLAGITKRTYLDMLEEHAKALHTTRQDGETAAKFVKRVRCRLIAYEEQTKIYRVSGKSKNHYYKGLPEWGQVQAFIGDVIAQLDEALAQQTTATFTTKRCDDDFPF